MKYIPKLQTAWSPLTLTPEKQQSDNTRVALKKTFTFPKLNSEQAFNYSAFGTLNSPNNNYNFIQGYKKTPQQQSLSNLELNRVEKLENIQKQKIQEAENLRHAAEVAPYIIPGLGQAMWLGKGVDLVTNSASDGKYKSWGNMVDQKTGSGEFVGDLTNPGYYAGAFPKLLSKGIQSTSKYALQKAEPYLMGDKRIPMMNVYKPKQEFWNPFKKENKFIPNNESYYRVIGDESGYNDLINSGVVRPNQNGIFAGRSTYYTKGAINDINNPVIGGGVKKGTAYKGDYIVEINKNDTHFPTQEHGLNKDWNFGITKPGNEIPYSSEYLNVYKRSGNNYIKLDKKETPFRSEINWGKWNKEIPSNKPLMDEYLQIEKNTKQNGTWMNNSDGSAFDGTPEQFIQQNSENFKKAFPDPIKENGRIIQLLHHSKNNFDFFDESKNLTGTGLALNGKGVYTIPKPFYDKRVAKNLKELMDDSSGKSVLIDYGDVRYDLYSNSNNITRHSHRNRINVTPETKYEDIFTVVSPYTNRLKSAIGNNGMFDMTNPNIYKGIIPAIGTYGLTRNKKE